MPFFINELELRGRGLPSIEEFASSLNSMEIAEDTYSINQYGMITNPDLDLLLPVQTSAQYFRFMPGPEFSPRLYRGETEFHSSCVPSIFRNGINSIDRCFLIGKRIELSALMDLHPATKGLCALRIGHLSFDLNIEAIAQHYGFKTGLMDFSRSRDVAMFFATCRYDLKTETYNPLDEGWAVLYTADLKGLIEHRKASSSFLPLGLEPLPRPEAQRALAVRLNPGENLNDMPWVAHEVMEITRELSRRYFDMFDGGSKLFPSNPFDDYVRSIRDSKLLPLEALSFGMDLELIPRHSQGIKGVKSALLAAGYKVELCPMKVDPAIIQDAVDTWGQQRESYYSRIKVRGVCDHMVIE